MDESDFKQHYIVFLREITGLDEEVCRDFVWDIIDNYKQMFEEKTVRVVTDNCKWRIRQKNRHKYVDTNG